MGTKELQDKIKILTGEMIPEEKLGLLWALFLSEMKGACNVNEFNGEQQKELEDIFLMQSRTGAFSSGTSGGGDKEIKSIREGDVTVEYAVSGSSDGGNGGIHILKKRFIARNRRLKCLVRTERQ